MPAKLGCGWPAQAPWGGELRSSDARIRTPRDSGTFHDSFLEQWKSLSYSRVIHTLEKTHVLDLGYQLSTFLRQDIHPEVFTKCNLWGQGHLAQEGLRNSAQSVSRVCKNARKEILLGLNTKRILKKKKKKSKFINV